MSESKRESSQAQAYIWSGRASEKEEETKRGETRVLTWNKFRWDGLCGARRTLL
jgi:hypothetical protein